MAENKLVAEQTVANDETVIFTLSAATKVKALIDLKENVDATTECGNSVLHYASFLGYTDIMNILIHAGANVNIPNNAGQTPLNVAISEKIVFKRQSC